MNPAHIVTSLVASVLAVFGGAPHDFQLGTTPTTGGEHGASTAQTAEHTSVATEGGDHKGGQGGLTATNISCVGSAVATREASIASAVTTFSSAVSAAYTARTSDLSTAYSKTTVDEVKAGVKVAWTSFKNAMKSARTALKTGEQSAWKTFATAAKACGGTTSSGIIDSTNQTSEVSGQ